MLAHRAAGPLGVEHRIAAGSLDVHGRGIAATDSTGVERASSAALSLPIYSASRWATLSLHIEDAAGAAVPVRIRDSAFTGEGYLRQHQQSPV